MSVHSGLDELEGEKRKHNRIQSVRNSIAKLYALGGTSNKLYAYNVTRILRNVIDKFREIILWSAVNQYELICQLAIPVV